MLVYTGISLCSDHVVEPSYEFYSRQPTTFSLCENGDYVATRAINFGGYPVDLTIEGLFISDSLRGDCVLPFKGNCPIFIPSLAFRQFPLGLYTLSAKFLNILRRKANVVV